MTKPRISSEMRQALWNIQRDGGMILTYGSGIETPYTTKLARPIHTRTARALIAAGELVPENQLFPGESPTAWTVRNPVDQEPV
jgi:hypothetical protein